MHPADYLRSQNLTRLVLYYPGAGTDDGPLTLIGENVTTAVVIYADYGVDEKAVTGFVTSLPQFQVGNMRWLEPSILGVATWAEAWALDTASRRFHGPERAFGLQCGLHRRGLGPFGHPDRSRMRFQYFATEAVGTYSLLLRGRDDMVPRMVVLQDHGFGGYWTLFGGRSEMWRAAADANKLPEHLFVAENTEPWPGYQRVTDYAPQPGQMHEHARAFFRLTRS